MSGRIGIDVASFHIAAHRNQKYMSVAWDELVQIIHAGQRFVLTSHVRPDCDALGSELGLAGILEALGKEVAIVNAHATPPNIAFIDPETRIQALGADIQIDAIPEHDVFVILDTSAWVQLGEMSEVVKTTSAKKIVIDHHVSEDDLGATSFKNTTAEATGRLIAELASHLGVTLTPRISMPLFAALVTDTGWLRFSAVTDESFQIAAQLVAGGADPTWIYGQLYEQDTLARCRLRGRLMSRMETIHDGRLVHTYAQLVDFKETGAMPTDTEDIINQGLAISGTEVGAILVEQSTGGFKISFRSRCHVDCSQVASQFGGGGHKAAAGAFLDGPLEDVQPKVLDALSDALFATGG